MPSNLILPYKYQHIFQSQKREKKGRNGAATVTLRTPFFLHFSKFQNQKLSLKHRNYPSKHVHHTPRSKNHPFSAQESERIEA
jgi:hypothetical protein